MDRFQMIVEDQLWQVDAMCRTYSRHLKELEEYRNANLRKSGKKDGKTYYYSCNPRTGKRSYLGTDSSADVRLIKEARFCRELVRMAEKDKQLLRHVIDEYRPLEYDVVNESLPQTYRGAKMDFSERTQTDKRVKEWKKLKMTLKNRVVEKYPDDLKHTALDGTLVRSKSEMDIANMLILNHIPYVYECPYFFDGEILRFDFTALSTIDYESEVIVEHQGMMDLDSYRDKYMHTLLTCLSYGLVPNVDIFFTFEDMNGNFDSRQIWDIIKAKLMKQGGS